MTAFYDEDVAYAHHVGFADVASHAGDEVARVLTRDGPTAGLAIDLGCGSGIWAGRLGSLGYEVLAVDVSQSMLELARANAPRAKLVRANIFDIGLRPCAVVTSFGEVLNYCAPGKPTEAGVQRLLEAVARSLAPNGLFVFDVIVTTEGELMRYRTFRQQPDWAVLLDVQEAAEARLITRDITVFKRVEHGYRRSEERHVLAVFDRTMLEDWLAGAGFTFTASRSYGSFELPSRRLAYVCRRTSVVDGARSM